MNTNIRNILREGLIVEASKKQILTQKIGWDEESADMLDRLCGPLSVLIGNKIIEQGVNERGTFPDNITQAQKHKMVIDELNYEKYIRSNRQIITSIMDWIRVGLNGNLGENKNLSFRDLYLASNKWHDELEVGQGDINYIEENPIILDFRDENGNGFYWADLQTSSSKEECDRMGHCGTSGAGDIYSLRQVIPLSEKHKLNKSILTAAIGKEGMGGFNRWSIYIDWGRVAEDYSGIEIAPYLYEARMKHMWYYGWDVASGCIWGKGVVKNITKIS